MKPEIEAALNDIASSRLDRGEFLASTLRAELERLTEENIAYHTMALEGCEPQLTMETFHRLNADNVRLTERIEAAIKLLSVEGRFETVAVEAAAILRGERDA